MGTGEEVYNTPSTPQKRCVTAPSTETATEATLMARRTDYKLLARAADPQVRRTYRAAFSSWRRTRCLLYTGEGSRRREYVCPKHRQVHKRKSATVSQVAWDKVLVHTRKRRIWALEDPSTMPRDLEALELAAAVMWLVHKEAEERLEELAAGPQRYAKWKMVAFR
ncbi:hypothetical protein LDHU3_24.0720:CDS1 [Leishmania donovani]|uniref:Hypothetical_protein n=1 Tax=Leishmania donovani TaxID=5661 RepID=A0A6J8FCE4_LEIDO|nr:hypothetical protein LDHU3_24.0720:CDS1 [Leishmania donovani]VDZ45006.1 hypothetical_protein [Leishmania donovani]